MKPYAKFNGHSRHSEYRGFVLIDTLISLFIYLTRDLFGLFDTRDIVYSLAVFIPGLAVGVLKLHDTGRIALPH